jgi:hypothetical protein
MPHIHSMTIFDVDRIEITFDRNCNCYGIKLFRGDADGETSAINIWRNSAGGQPPTLRLRDIVEGVDFTATRENENALVAHDHESD